VICAVVAYFITVLSEEETRANMCLIHHRITIQYESCYFCCATDTSMYEIFVSTIFCWIRRITNFEKPQLKREQSEFDWRIEN
jgi:hypothetical protein